MAEELVKRVDMSKALGKNFTKVDRVITRTKEGTLFVPTKPQEFRDFLRANPDLMAVHNIAFILSRITRFRGNMDYTVAQHCVRGADAFYIMGRYTDAMQFLLHDAVEMVYGDIPRPVLAEYPLIRDYQKAITGTIFTWFGLPKDMSPEVKTLDTNLSNLESVEYIESPYDDAWPQEQAERAFMNMYEKILYARLQSE